jgi:hypothetical protein
MVFLGTLKINTISSVKTLQSNFIRDVDMDSVIDEHMASKGAVVIEETRIDHLRFSHLVYVWWVTFCRPR